MKRVSGSRTLRQFSARFRKKTASSVWPSASAIRAAHQSSYEHSSVRLTPSPLSWSQG